MHLTVPSTEALAMLSPDAEKRQRLIGLVWPKNVSCNESLKTSKHELSNPTVNDQIKKVVETKCVCQRSNRSKKINYCFYLKFNFHFRKFFIILYFAIKFCNRKTLISMIECLYFFHNSVQLSMTLSSYPRQGSKSQSLINMYQLHFYKIESNWKGL